jgi:hypothetical protein
MFVVLDTNHFTEIGPENCLLHSPKPVANSGT